LRSMSTIGLVVSSSKNKQLHWMSTLLGLSIFLLDLNKHNHLNNIKTLNQQTQLQIHPLQALHHQHLWNQKFTSIKPPTWSPFIILTQAFYMLMLLIFQIKHLNRFGMQESLMTLFVGTIGYSTWFRILELWFM
jgi:hypothetical protein